MELPEIMKRIGKIEDKRKIYIEDYVLTYLESFKNGNTDENFHVILCGRKIQSISEEIYIINGAEIRRKEEMDTKNSIFAEYEDVGCLNIEIWKKTQGMCEGILIGDSNGGQPIEGYYIFYEKNQAMEEYLSLCFEKKRQSRKVLPELIALNNEEMLTESPLYSYIRAAVICIFIIFCAIAVTTINSFEKIEEFTDVTIQIEKTLEEP